MKSFFITALFLMLATLSFSQSDSAYICKFIDKMTDVTYLLPSRNCVIANEEKTKGIVLKPLLIKDKSFTLYAKAIGIGSCSEHDKIIILFKNGEKLKLTSWNSFDCKGVSYFNLSKNDLNSLRTQEIVTVYLQNGRSYDSFTQDVTEMNKRYFIQILKSIDDGNYSIIEE